MRRQPHNWIATGFQLMAVLGIVAVLGTLPVCDAAAYVPFTNADDFRTVTERRDITTVETEPGVRYLHGHASQPDSRTCAICQESDPPNADHVTVSDTFVERVAYLQRADHTIADSVASDRPGVSVVPATRSDTPEIQPPRTATIA